jgi:hypothetical protein
MERWRVGHGRGVWFEERFSAAQAVLFLTSCWVLLSTKQNIIMRSLALMSVVGCPFLLIAGRSADSVSPVVLATGITTSGL